MTMTQNGDNMQIEEIRTYLKEQSGLDEEQTGVVIDAIVQLRSAAYSEGWDDCLAEFEGRAN